MINKDAQVLVGSLFWLRVVTQTLKCVATHFINKRQMPSTYKPNVYYV